MEPFGVGVKYRRQELLDFVGSQQQQSGIIWGEKEPGCVICTSGGRHSKRVGYEDGQAADGTWHYIGQGAHGNQTTEAFANKLLVDGDKTVLFFVTREPTAVELRDQGDFKKQYEYVGAFHSIGYEFVTPAMGPRKGDRLIRFKLLPVIEQHERVRDGTPVENAELTLLRQRALANQDQPDKRLSIAVYRERSLFVRRYALARAAGTCEKCGSEAPFLDGDGRPFLEVHHIFRLADDGPDKPSNVVALCPNCHREAHFSRDRLLLQRDLAALAGQLEERAQLHARDSA